MPHRKLGLEMLPTYANSWSPRSLVARTPPVKLDSWSTVPAGTSTTPFRYERWTSPGLLANGPVGERYSSSVTQSVSE
jgi:hypothetical protein